MANVLKAEKQEMVLRCLVDGASVRATERITNVHRDTILRLMVRAGTACANRMHVDMRGLFCQRIQVDELWCYVGKKQRHIQPKDNPHRAGDFWTFVALDPDSKIVPCYRVGKRDRLTANAFMLDLASRMANRVQISSDGLRAYVEATDRAFGGEVDYGQVVKSYEAEYVGPGRYSPPKVTAIKRTAISGTPAVDHMSTSLVERQNLTMRMSMRRFTRLTNAFSKKVENLKAAVALHFMYYNYVRIHKTLRVTPAIEAGVASRVWTFQDLLNPADA